MDTAMSAAETIALRPVQHLPLIQHAEDVPSLNSRAVRHSQAVPSRFSTLPASDIETHSWRPVITAALTATIAEGRIVLAGTAFGVGSVTSWPASGVLSLTNDATTYAWIDVKLDGSSMTFGSGTSAPGDPATPDDTERVLLFEIVCAGGNVTSIRKHQCSDIRIDRASA